MERLARLLDLLLLFAKWPVAVSSVLLLPALLFCLAFGLLELTSHPAIGIPLAVGAGSYLVWYLAYGRRSFHHLMSTTIHELIHSLFATLTMHRVVGIAATSAFGGQMQYVGKGSWLVKISPYCFPLPSLLLLLLLTICQPTYQPFLLIALGGTLAFDVLSNLRQLHRHQSDLKEVGWLFTYALLPGANALVIGMIITGISQGLRAFGELPASAVTLTLNVVLGTLW